MTNPSVKTDDEKEALRIVASVPSDGCECYLILQGDAREIGAIYGPQCDETEALAHKLAAAPDMLEALKSVQAWLLSTKPMPEESKEIWHSAFVNANNLVAAAIAKATQS